MVTVIELSIQAICNTYHIFTAYYTKSFFIILLLIHLDINSIYIVLMQHK